MNLTPFLSSDPYRFILQSPHLAPDGRVFATDGKILIIGPPECFEDAKLNPSLQAPDIHHVLLPDDQYDLTPVTLPEHFFNSTPPTKTCSECDGSKLVTTKTCPECDGHGEVECCECGQDTKCRECDGDGRIRVAHSDHPVPCDICAGSGTVPDLEEIPITHPLVQPDPYDGVTLGFNGEFLRRFHTTIPGFTIHPPTADSRNSYQIRHPHSPVKGLIMPLRIHPKR